MTELVRKNLNEYSVFEDIELLSINDCSAEDYAMLKTQINALQQQKLLPEFSICYNLDSKLFEDYVDACYEEFCEDLSNINASAVVIESPDWLVIVGNPEQKPINLGVGAAYFTYEDGFGGDDYHGYYPEYTNIKTEVETLFEPLEGDGEYYTFKEFFDHVLQPLQEAA